ncbi:hypothetical protein [Embleya sp. NBC_00896]|uniref:hypothetical protein n=1 Tax=Embleya sp. NBC_00896 TaxID=2975961 RepID=UPI00386DEEFF|nr:hypothetical protein OG928_29200 [Embleya sp. NBC_00896]
MPTAIGVAEVVDQHDATVVEDRQHRRPRAGSEAHGIADHHEIRIPVDDSDVTAGFAEPGGDRALRDLVGDGVLGGSVEDDLECGSGRIDEEFGSIRPQFLIRGQCGLSAAYAQARVGERTAVRRLVDRCADEQGWVPYDLVLLAEDRRIADRVPVTPTYPLMRAGWQTYGATGGPAPDHDLAHGLRWVAWSTVSCRAAPPDAPESLWRMTP